MSKCMSFWEREPDSLYPCLKMARRGNSKSQLGLTIPYIMIKSGKPASFTNCEATCASKIMYAARSTGVSRTYRAQTKRGPREGNPGSDADYSQTSSCPGIQLYRLCAKCVVYTWIPFPRAKKRAPGMTN